MPVLGLAFVPSMANLECMNLGADALDCDWQWNMLLRLQPNLKYMNASLCRFWDLTKELSCQCEQSGRMNSRKAVNCKPQKVLGHATHQQKP